MKATQRAAAAQVEAAERTKRLQVRGVAVAVDLGFPTLETDIKRARNGLMRLKTDDRPLVGQAIMAGMQVIAKTASPILERNVDRLFMLGDEVSPLCLSLMLADASMNRVGSMNRDEWPMVVHELELSLVGLSDKVAECKRAVQTIRDDTTN